MALYRMKPVHIEAIQWDGDNFVGRTIPAWLSKGFDSRTLFRNVNEIQVITPTGPKHAGPGDWITRDRNGVFGVCRGEAFKALYEPLD